MDKKYALALAVFITALAFLFIYRGEWQGEVRESVFVTRIIDGDTFETSEGNHIRLSNINTPEKKEAGYAEAKEYLNKYENKTVEVVYEGKDISARRDVARVYNEDTYINLDLVHRGLAVKAWVNPSEAKQFFEAEQFAINNQNGLWKSSQFAGCVLINLDPENEKVTMIVTCENISMNGWYLRDESRKAFKFVKTPSRSFTVHSSNGINNLTDLFWDSATPIWNNDRDSLYLFDAHSRLVSYYHYGY